MVVIKNHNISIKKVIPTKIQCDKAYKNIIFSLNTYNYILFIFILIF